MKRLNQQITECMVAIIAVMFLLLVVIDSVSRLVIFARRIFIAFLIFGAFVWFMVRTLYGPKFKFSAWWNSIVEKNKRYQRL